MRKEVKSRQIRVEFCPFNGQPSLVGVAATARLKLQITVTMPRSQEQVS